MRTIPQDDVLEGWCSEKRGVRTTERLTERRDLDCQWHSRDDEYELWEDWERGREKENREMLMQSVERVKGVTCFRCSTRCHNDNVEEKVSEAFIHSVIDSFLAKVRRSRTKKKQGEKKKILSRMFSFINSRANWKWEEWFFFFARHNTEFVSMSVR